MTMHKSHPRSKSIRNVVAVVGVLGLLWIAVSIPFVAASDMKSDTKMSMAAFCMLVGMNLMCVAVAYAAGVGLLGRSALGMRLLAVFLLYAAYGTILTPIPNATPAGKVLIGAANGLVGIVALGVIIYFNNRLTNTHSRAE
jgi:hypothetical protein